jgi:hypothetical protein
VQEEQAQQFLLAAALEALAATVILSAHPLWLEMAELVELLEQQVFMPPAELL